MRQPPWFPMNYSIGEGISLKKMVLGKPDFQIYECEIQDSNDRHILIADKKLHAFWLEMAILEPEIFFSFHFGETEFFSVSTDHRWLGPIPLLGVPEDFSHALLFATALKRTRVIAGNVSLKNCIFFERQAALLPVFPENQDEGITDDFLLGTFLTGGVFISSLNFKSLKNLAFGIKKEEVQKLNLAAGIELPLISEKLISEKQREKNAFRLVGRPKLEKFLQDNVIDIVQFPEKYKKFGINFPSAAILHGPPGCGKTFAVEMLVDFLDWPCFRVDSGSIGSKYIHETSKKISETFNEAIEKAPSVMIIDEMDAFLTDRDRGSEYKIEEVAEFLRKIPEALEKKVLIFGMTNRIDLIDRAVLRRGRFDHVIEVGMPSIEEIEALLVKLFTGKPIAENTNYKRFSRKFSGKPLSDISFFVRESARIAAKNNKENIDDISLQEALIAVLSRVENTSTSNWGSK